MKLATMKMMNRLLKQALILLMVSCLASFAHAQEGISIEKNGYTVFYSVFNSAFLTPEIASTYQLVRDDDQALLNIVVTQSDADATSLGLPAQISGTARNLIQQTQKLEFKTIQEQNTVYYLAPIKHINEEVFHFNIEVIPENSDQPIALEFSKKLYVDR